MKSILEELCVDNIHTGDRGFKRGSEYDRVSTSFVEADNKFRSMLDESQLKAYEDVLAARFKVNYLELTDKFIYGFRMGAMITTEVYNTSDNYIFGGI